MQGGGGREEGRRGGEDSWQGRGTSPAAVVTASGDAEAPGSQRGSAHWAGGERLNAAVGLKLGSHSSISNQNPEEGMTRDKSATQSPSGVIFPIIRLRSASLPPGMSRNVRQGFRPGQQAPRPGRCGLADRAGQGRRAAEPRAGLPGRKGERSGATWLAAPWPRTHWGCIHRASGKGVSEPWGQSRKQAGPRLTEPAFRRRRGMADTARSGRDGKQTEDRGGPRSLRERLTFELLESAGPLTSGVTCGECLHLPAPACGLDREQETMAARGGGRARATCVPPAPSLHSPAQFRCCHCCSPRGPALIRGLNTTVSFPRRPPGPHLPLSLRYPSLSPGLRRYLFPCFLISARLSEPPGARAPVRRGAMVPQTQHGTWLRVGCSDARLPGGWGGGEQMSKQAKGGTAGRVDGWEGDGTK